jgi:hypothetical protein
MAPVEQGHPIPNLLLRKWNKTATCERVKDKPPQGECAFLNPLLRFFVGKKHIGSGRRRHELPGRKLRIVDHAGIILITNVC